MIGVIDYKAGNAPSVLNALGKLEVDAKLVSDPAELSTLTGIILPGVGSAQATMDSLSELGLVSPLAEKVLEDKVPFLGICVGLQVLFEHSEEEETTCLGWLKGDVRRFPASVRVPQIGWNETEFVRSHPLIQGLDSSEYFYFVNSYYVVPQNNSIVLAKTDYAGEFCSMIAQDNIYAAQFHLEKSGTVGLRLLKNFTRLAGGTSC